MSHVEWSDLDDIDYDCEAVWQDAKTVEVEREVYSCGGKGERAQEIKLHLQINGRPVEMELDTGSADTLMSEEKFCRVWPSKSADSPQLQECQTKLRSYTGNKIRVKGKAIVEVKVKPQNQRM